MDISIDPTSEVAPFEQLRAQVAARVATGDLPAGTRLPTVRRLAADLGLATNTVARAYRELEADGVVATHGRGGTIVRSAVLEDRVTSGLAESYVRSARQRGLTLAEAVALVERTWSSSSPAR